MIEKSLGKGHSRKWLIALITYASVVLFFAALSTLNLPNQARSISVTPSSSSSSGLPSAPTGVSAIAGNAQATVTWSAPTSNGGSPIVDYIVVPSPGTAIDTGSTKTTYTVRGLVKGFSYSFVVIAVRVNGNSVMSVPSNSTIVS